MIVSRKKSDLSKEQRWISTRLFPRRRCSVDLGSGNSHQTIRGVSGIGTNEDLRCVLQYTRQSDSALFQKKPALDATKGSGEMHRILWILLRQTKV